jgi:hypothetical protein
MRRRPPALPMQRMLPALPILRIDPALPIFRMLPALPMLKIEPTLPTLKTDPALATLSTLNALKMDWGLRKLWTLRMRTPLYRYGVGAASPRAGSRPRRRQRAPAEGERMAGGPLGLAPRQP